MSLVSSVEHKTMRPLFGHYSRHRIRGRGKGLHYHHAAYKWGKAPGTRWDAVVSQAAKRSLVMACDPSSILG